MDLRKLRNLITGIMDNTKIQQLLNLLNRIEMSDDY